MALGTIVALLLLTVWAGRIFASDRKSHVIMLLIAALLDTGIVVIYMYTLPQPPLY